MKDLTSKLAGIGLLSIVLLIGMPGCATDSEYAQRQKMMEKYGVREATFSEDGIGAYISPFGFRHKDE